MAKNKTGGKWRVVIDGLGAILCKNGYAGGFCIPHFECDRRKNFLRRIARLLNADDARRAAKSKRKKVRK